MSTLDSTMQMFRYRAQAGGDGKPFAGTIEASDAQDARHRLARLGLWVVEMEPEPPPAKARPLRGDDFQAFNEQLAHLAKAGLPIEEGLRLIARDMRSGRLAAAVRQVADELARGTPLPQAFEARRGLFPPLYGQIVEAGIKSNRLPDILLNLGRHLELTRRLRVAFWQVMAYPIMVLLMTVLVLAFLQAVVVPQFKELFDELGAPLPSLTLLVLWLGTFKGLVFLAAAGGAVALLVLIFLVMPRREQLSIVEATILPLPLIGPVLRAGLTARWCDALRLGVEAGLDLPAAVNLAGRSLLWPSAQFDSRKLVACLESGGRLESVVNTRLISPTVLAVIGLGVTRGGLAQNLATLTEMYQQQSEIRLGAVPAALNPIMLILLGATIGFVVMALFLPVIALITALTSGSIL